MADPESPTPAWRRNGIAPRVKRALDPDLIKGSAGPAGLAASTALIGVVLARMLSVTDLAHWFFAMATSGLLSTVALLGVPGVAVRRLATGEFDARTVLRSSVVATSTTCMVIMVILLGPIAPVIRHSVDGRGADRLPVMIVLLLLAQVAQRLISEIARGTRALAIAGLVGGALSRFVTLGALLAVYVSGHRLGLWPVIWLQLVVSTAVLVGLGPWVVLRALRSFSGSQDGSFRIRDTGWLAVHNAASQVVMQGDLVIAGLVLSAASVADYGVALRFAALAALPMQGLNVAGLPMMASHLSSRGPDHDELHRRILRMARPAALASALITLVTLVAGWPILGFVLGSEYRSAWPMLALLCLGQFVNTATGP
jgi:O-antigen/teichoic acid export membrane protein